MHSYRFRILTDDDEDFLMDIEVKATQTFLDFHNAIKKFCNILSNELASFYICDDNWRKKTEIMLIDMSEPENKEQQKPYFVMENAYLNQIINNPHQKLMYVYDFIKMHTFYVELIKINKTSDSIDYPALIKKEGSLNLNTPSGMLGFIDDDDAEDSLHEDNENFFGTEADPDEMDSFDTDIYLNDTDKFDE